MSKRKLSALLVTGGCGFIGTNFIRYLFEQPDFTGIVVNIDKCTYAGNPQNLADIRQLHGDSRYFFYPEDICDPQALQRIFSAHPIDTVIHFAAESHVDRSIHGPRDFIQTNIMGTFTLLETVRNFWKDFDGRLFHHISTDEVYGSLPETGLFYEHTAYDPRSPYSASKAGSDHLVKAYFHTYGFPITLSNCSNNYGPYQFPEKLIPFMLCNILDSKNLPVYGTGSNIRDWLYVQDHCSAVWSIVQNGILGETYNIGGENEWRNIDLLKTLIRITASKKNLNENKILEQIVFVKDRAGHDQRYAINCDKIKNQLGWKQSVDFLKGLSQTVDWYLEHTDWLESIKSGNYKNWIKTNYGF